MMGSFKPIPCVSSRTVAGVCFVETEKRMPSWMKRFSCTRVNSESFRSSRKSTWSTPETNSVSRSRTRGRWTEFARIATPTPMIVSIVRLNTNR